MLLLLTLLMVSNRRQSTLPPVSAPDIYHFLTRKVSVASYPARMQGSTLSAGSVC